MRTKNRTGFPAKHRKIFTLVELLIVISIIVILASILLPALNKVKSKTLAILCLANQCQLGIGINMYVDDNNDFFMPHTTGLTGDSYVTNLYGCYIPSGMVFLCPSVPTDDFTRCWKDGDMTDVYTVPQYGYNFRYLGTNRFESNYDPAIVATAKCSRIRHPSATITLTDVYNAHVTDKIVGCYYLPAEFTTVGGLVDCRHGGAANILWVDGHVQGAKNSVVGTGGPYISTRNPYMGDYFRFGHIRGHIDNYFDLL